MDECDAVSTPVDINQKFSLDMCPKSEKDKNVPYMEAIGCLLYAAQNRMPDICYSVNLLSRFSTK